MKRPFPLLASSLVASSEGYEVKVTGMYRYAVKGLSPDCMPSVFLKAPSGTFPNDRRYALKKEGKEFNGEWLHKENFLCAFTHPQLLATLKTSFKDDSNLISIENRESGEQLLKVQLDTAEGKLELGNFLSDLSGERVTCIDSSCSSSPLFQFGNTSSGWKRNKDSRTVHIINQQTVKAVSEKLGIPLNPLRFRPNIVVDAEPWSEFTDWVPNSRTLVSANDGNDLALQVVSKTVRCEGVSIDPSDPGVVLDIPKLLNDNFDHGPYLGVYAVTSGSGTLSERDALTVNHN